MKHYYKVRLRLASGPAELWVAIRAHSMGEAIVIADTRTLGTLFSVCDDPATEITEQEYHRMLAEAKRHRGF